MSMAQECFSLLNVVGVICINAMNVNEINSAIIYYGSFMKSSRFTLCEPFDILFIKIYLSYTGYYKY